MQARSREPNTIAALFLYLFCTSLALYPLLAQFAGPIIVLAFAGILCNLMFKIFFSKLHIAESPIYKMIGAMLVVYATWIFIAVLLGNDNGYIFLDSQGFLIYLVMPFLFVFVIENRLEHKFVAYLFNLCLVIAGISAIIIIGYFLLVGPPDSESLFVMNAFFAGYDLNWRIDNNSGFLGLYTYTGHILLIGTGLSFYRYTQTGRVREIFFIALFAFGMFADGHRALMVAFLLLVVLMMPLIAKIIGLQKMLLILGVLLLICMISAFFSGDWLMERFNFSSDDPSTLERFLQIPALMDKIGERPFFGNGFGAFARVIRSTERPFSYEVDFLATWMKLGLIGAALYFGTYLAALNRARISGGPLGYVLFSVGLAFFLYMGTNGNSAMSTDSAVFHMLLFVLIALNIRSTPQANDPTVQQITPALAA
jgi:hypothetical protein